MCLFACSYALLLIKDSLSFVMSWIACVAIDLSIFMLISRTVDYMLSWALDHLLLSLLVMCLGTVSLDIVSLTQYQGIDFFCLFGVVFQLRRRTCSPTSVITSSCWFFFICAFNDDYHFSETKEFEMRMMGERNYLLELQGLDLHLSSLHLTAKQCDSGSSFYTLLLCMVSLFYLA